MMKNDKVEEFNKILEKYRIKNRKVFEFSDWLLSQKRKKYTFGEKVPEKGYKYVSKNQRLEVTRK